MWATAPEDVCRQLAADTAIGLTSHEAQRRRDRFGSNQLVSEPAVPTWRRVVEQFDDPLVLLLLAAIVVSFVAWAFEGGQDLPVDAIVIAAIVILNAGLGLWQEGKATQAVAALQQMTAVHSRVVRDGEVRSVANADLVPGDIVELGEGDAVGADARLLQTADLQVDEASLTGESMPVVKGPDPVPPRSDLADRSSMVFSGTGVTRGRATAVVTAIGMSSEVGRIASLVGRDVEPRTPLQRQVDWLGRVLGLTVVVLATIVVGAVLLTSDVTSLANLLEAVLVGVSLAVAAVPEGLPAILSVVLALGVQRMAAHDAVVKRLSSVETLGSASVICTDKTGTLTRNEMAIVQIATASGRVEVSGSGYQPFGEVLLDGSPLRDAAVRREVEAVLVAGSLANDASIQQDEAGGPWSVLGDPTEAAFLVAERKLDLADRRRRFTRVDEIPFSSERRLMSSVDREGGDARDTKVAGPPVPAALVMSTKGAPDVLLQRCSHERVHDAVVPMTAERRRAILADVDELADQALRTLAVANRPLPEDISDVDESLERDLIYLGTVGIIDPPREEVSAAIDEAKRAGIRVMMITGDHPRTAARIAARLGIARDGVAAVTGSELDESLVQASRTRTVFARVAPEHKLGIVEALQADGQVVAMTGDGVNDAPALRQADIGVAMGINGTEVSKEASDLILADDNFATILHAVREGREIFDNIRKFLRYLLASNTGEVLVVFIGVIAASALGLAQATDGLAVPLLATQILWINLVTDSALALALGVDPPVDDVMARTPRRLDERIIDGPMVATIGVIGVTSSLAGLVALDLELTGGLLGGSGDIRTARTMVFTTIVLAQVFNALNARSGQVSAFVRPFPNRMLWGAILATVSLQVLVVHAPPLNAAFSTEPLDLRRWITCVLLAATVLIAEELHKAVSRARSRAAS